MLVSRIGQISLASGENKTLTGEDLRPDGLGRLERAAGWTVIDPAQVVAVVWNDETESSPGQFL